MSIAWSDDLVVGHPLIDAQHRQLFAHFDAFLEACNQRRGPQQLRELFGFLDNYAATHFAVEEELMQRLAYPDIAEHLAQHHRFTERFGAMQQELTATGPTVELLVVTTKTMAYWLSEHIRHTDLKLVTFLRQHPTDFLT